MIDQKFIEQLKSKNDIVEVVSAYCSLEKRGGSYWARCPLPGHMEKTPSFSVNPSGQFFYCFGCSRGGDVIKFIMEVENLNRMEAIRFLASRAGLQMPEGDFEDEKKRDEKIKEKQRRLAVLKETAHFYVRNLKDPKGKPYLDYFYSRGFDDRIIRGFGLGCSPDYHSLVRHLKSLGYSYEDMLGAGVVSYKQETNEYIDFEGGRAVIPIIDSFDAVVAFVGRVLVKKPDRMKYKNTSDTSIFQKGRCIFNINNLKKLKREIGNIPYVVMVEGQIDVISVYSAGIRNVAASMGTSLTPEQARLLLRYTDTVVISYDGDAAGQKATFRGLEIFKNAGLTVKVASLPEGLDPDEYIKKYGAESYKKLLEEAVPLIDYKLMVVRKTFDENTIDGRRKIVDASLRVIAESDKDFEREELLKKLSEYTRLTYQSLKRDLENGTRDALKALPKAAAEITVPDESSATVKAERFILYSLIKGKNYADIYELEDMDFTLKRYDIFNFLLEKADEGEKVAPSTVLDYLGEEFINEINAVFIVGDSIKDEAAENYYKDCVRFLKRSKIEGEIKDLQEYFATENDLDARRTIAEQIKKKLMFLEKLKTEEKK